MRVCALRSPKTPYFFHSTLGDVLGVLEREYHCGVDHVVHENQFSLMNDAQLVVAVLSDGRARADLADLQGPIFSARQKPTLPIHFLVPEGEKVEINIQDSAREEVGHYYTLEQVPHLIYKRVELLQAKLTQRSMLV